jgi:hypothetical protein
MSRRLTIIGPKLAHTCTDVDLNWLASLPRHDEALARCDDGVNLTALLMPAPQGRVRFAIWPLCLDFSAEDVVEISEITPPADAPAATLIAVNATLRPGAPLLDLFYAGVKEAMAMGGPVPFALATRPGQLVLPVSLNFRAAEAEYLRRHGLDR